MTRYAVFDRCKLHLRELAARGHDVHWQQCLPLQPVAEPYAHPEFAEFARRGASPRHGSRGERSYYFQGDHRQTIPTLWQRLTMPAATCGR